MYTGAYDPDVHQQCLNQAVTKCEGKKTSKLWLSDILSCRLLPFPLPNLVKNKTLLDIDSLHRVFSNYSNSFWQEQATFEFPFSLVKTLTCIAPVCSKGGKSLSGRRRLHGLPDTYPMHGQ